MNIDESFPGKDYKCWLAKKKDTDIMELPFSQDRTLEEFELPPDWKEIFIEKLGEMKNKYRSWQLYLDICVRCGACADKCHYYIGTKDPKNMPMGFTGDTTRPPARYSASSRAQGSSQRKCFRNFTRTTTSARSAGDARSSVHTG
jgi:ferredoxin